MKFRIIKEVDHSGQEIFKIEWFRKRWYWGGEWVNAGRKAHHYSTYFRRGYLTLENAEKHLNAFKERIKISQTPKKISVVKEFEI